MTVDERRRRLKLARLRRRQTIALRQAGRLGAQARATAQTTLVTTGGGTTTTGQRS